MTSRFNTQNSPAAPAPGCHPARPAALQALTLALAGLSLSLAGCGDPTPAGPAATAANPATPANSTSSNTAATPATTPATPATGTTAEKPADPPPPPPPPPVDETVDENQVQTVRKLVDESISADEKKAQPAIDRLKQMGSLAAVPLAEIVDKDTDAPQRRVAALDQLETLKFMTNPRATKAVLGALADPNAELKQHAIGVAGRHKIKEAMQPLKDILHDPAQKSLQVYAAQALVELGDPDAIVLAKTLLTSTDPIMRARAVYMIRKQGDHTQLKLLKPLATDPDPDVRTEVVEACGELGDVEAVEILAAMLDDKKHEIVRDACKHLKRITGVAIAREPEKWKEWYTKEFTPKGRAAFGKAAEGPAEMPAPHPKVKKVPPAGGPDMPPPPPKGDDDGLGGQENGNEY